MEYLLGRHSHIQLHFTVGQGETLSRVRSRRERTLWLPERSKVAHRACGLPTQKVTYDDCDRNIIEVLLNEVLQCALSEIGIIPLLLPTKVRQVLKAVLLRRRRSLWEGCSLCQTHTG